MKYKLRAGHYYRTRDGKRCYIVAVDKNPLADKEPVKAIGFIEGWKSPQQWFLDGSVLSKGERPHDIVEIEHDRVVVSYIGRNEDGQFHIMQDREELARLKYHNIQEMREYWRGRKLLFIEKA